MAAFVSSFVVGAGKVGQASVSRDGRRVECTRRVVPKAQFNYNIYQDGAERSKRFVTDGDRAVQVVKPMGLVLEEGQDGMCFVASMDPNGNAASTGQIQVGDIVVAISATFGDEVWSTRGVGLGKIMKGISVRQGDIVTMVLESPMQVADQKKQAANSALNRRAEARERFGEREVLDPNTWGSVGGGRARSPMDDASFVPAPPPMTEGYQELTNNKQTYTPKVSESELQRQIQEEAAQGGGQQDNTILYGSIGFGVGLIVLIWLLSQ
ncbi:hypothetical protein NDN08_004372 [Rhodosorus marinus]|uniref:PDZ domain-containing protein n=1 Tax=Rhodosorus marinus TaxID=101924 RepID=A0AAV8UQA3_9RHOD|nr:hypothetical protein NDN08_004372 [Rhodosorus marinus]